MSAARAAAPIAVVLGTRPEIIKLGPVVAELGDLARPIFTGQHYDAELAADVLGAAGWPPIAHRLTGIGGQDRSRQIIAMIDQLTSHFVAERPHLVIVQGDTNSANAGAQAGHYAGIPVLHVEAGLRSYDRAMPEEINRLVIGAVADVHCCATSRNAQALLAAGTPPEAVHVTGNPIVEATRAAIPDPAGTAALLAEWCLRPDDFVLCTVHRPENTDDPARLRTLLDQLGRLEMDVLLPLHPRTRHRIELLRIGLPPSVRTVRPVDHPTFLGLAAAARLIVSDSGGVQEEVTVLGKPLVVVRNSTERPESVEAGFARLTAPEGIVRTARLLLRPSSLARLAGTECPFGDGSASRRIAVLARSAAGLAAVPGPRDRRTGTAAGALRG